MPSVLTFYSCLNDCKSVNGFWISYSEETGGSYLDFNEYRGTVTIGFTHETSALSGKYSGRSTDVTYSVSGDEIMMNGIYCTISRDSNGCVESITKQGITYTRKNNSAESR